MFDFGFIRISGEFLDEFSCDFFYDGNPPSLSEDYGLRIGERTIMRSEWADKCRSTSDFERDEDCLFVQVSFFLIDVEDVVWHA